MSEKDISEFFPNLNKVEVKEVKEIKENENRKKIKELINNKKDSNNRQSPDRKRKKLRKANVEEEIKSEISEQKEDLDAKVKVEVKKEEIKPIPTQPKVKKEIHPFFLKQLGVKNNKPNKEVDLSDVTLVKKENEEDTSPAEKIANIKLEDTDVKLEGESLVNLNYSQLCDIFEKIEANPKRLEKISILTKFFLQILKTKSNNEKEMSVIVMCIYLCINRIAPEYAGLELGIGEQVLIKAVVEATGTSSLKIKERLVKVGDLGEIAQEFRSTQKTIFQPKPLSLPFVFNTLKEIAQITGRSSMNQKIGKIKHMLISCQGKEAKYLIRSLEGKLRIGLAEKTVLVSLAQASVLYRNGTSNKEHLIKELEEASEAVKTAYSELPNYELIVPILIEKGYEQLAQHCKLVPGIPIKPMLAHPTKGLDAIFERFTNKDFICEYKYDGERAQIHLLPNGEVHIYSRNSEDMTSKYPDIIVNVGKFKKENVQSFVMDCEAVAWDKEEKKLLPFQILSTRKRKDVKEEDIKVKVVIFGFDLLYFNEKSLLRSSLDERKQLLVENFNELDGMFNFAKSLITNEVEDIQTFLDNSISDQCEGLMVKLLKGEESSYEPSKRSRNWLKVKKDYLTGIGDSVDLTVIGAYTGKGKRTGVYGGYLLACYDKDLEQYQSICKIGTGFSEEVLKNQFNELQKHIIQAPKSYYNYEESKGPDIWFEPAFVWEVKAADLSISPVYKAAIGSHDEEKGISLRFPRFIRVREDKTPENCTDSKQIAELYQKQLDLSNKKPNKVDIDDEDIY